MREFNRGSIRGLIRSERSAIKPNNRENDIALFKWPNDSLIASVGSFVSYTDLQYGPLLIDH